MIADLLPRYYEALGADPTFTLLRSIIIDGHETAWMKFEGTVAVDITGQGREGQPYIGYDFYCECDFTEGVGWEVKDGRHYSLDGKDSCCRKVAAIFLRQRELAQYYHDLFEGDELRLVFDEETHNYLSKIIFDLIEKVKAGEFIGEEGNGGSFWGGYFYLQTVGALTGELMEYVWRVAKRLVAEKKISLEGAVVCDYQEPLPPAWEEYSRVEKDGWVGIIHLPQHRRMLQRWKIELYRPDGIKDQESFLRLTHSPDFGPDVDDVRCVEEEMQRLITEATAKKEDL